MGVHTRQLECIHVGFFQRLRSDFLFTTISLYNFLFFYRIKLFRKFFCPIAKLLLFPFFPHSADFYPCNSFTEETVAALYHMFMQFLVMAYKIRSYFFLLCFSSPVRERKLQPCLTLWTGSFLRNMFSVCVLKGSQMQGEGGSYNGEQHRAVKNSPPHQLLWREGESEQIKIQGKTKVICYQELPSDFMQP